MEFRQVVIAGRVINRPADYSNVVKLNFCDPFEDGARAVELLTDGSFRFETAQIAGHNLTLVYGSFINLYTEPGDSVYVTIDASRFGGANWDAVRFSGSNAAFNNALNAPYSYLIGVMNKDRRPLNEALAPDAYMVELQQRIGEYTDSLAIYEREHGTFSAELHDFLRRDMRYALANRIMGYNRSDTTAQRDVLRLALFGDPMWEVSEPKNLKTMMFSYHLTTYLQSLILVDSSIRAAIEKQDAVGLIRSGMNVLTTHEKPTLCRDVMLWEMLTQVLDDVPGLYDSLPGINEAFAVPAVARAFESYIIGLRAEAQFSETPLKGVAYLHAAGDSLAVLPEGDIFAHFKTKYPGKVIYIDIYATWCGPCRTEIPYAAELHEAFNGKDVIFVNLCLASDREAWRKLVKEKGIQGENYWFGADATNLFMGAYGCSGYPTYMLMDREGRIVNQRAPRPSDKKNALQAIEGLL